MGADFQRGLHLWSGRSLVWFQTDDDGSCCRFISADLDRDEIGFSPLFVVLPGHSCQLFFFLLFLSLFFTSSHMKRDRLLNEWESFTNFCGRTFFFPTSGRGSSPKQEKDVSSLSLSISLSLSLWMKHLPLSRSEEKSKRFTPLFKWSQSCFKRFFEYFGRGGTPQAHFDMGDVRRLHLSS